METKIQIFSSPQFGEVRSAGTAESPWFCLADVCKALGLQNATVVARNVDEDSRSKFNLGRQGETIFINEDGLYDVILNSRKPSAKKFRKWVTSEVLPTIRKHGAYLTPEAIEKSLSDPDFIIQLATALKTEREQNARLTHENSEQRRMIEQQDMTIETQREEIKKAAPKVSYYDNTLQSVNTMTTTQIAKELGYASASVLNQLLKKANIIYYQSGMWMLHTPYSGWRLSQVRTTTYTRSDGTIGTNSITVWNERGRMFLHALHDNGFKPKLAIARIKGETVNS